MHIERRIQRQFRSIKRAKYADSIPCSSGVHRSKGCSCKIHRILCAIDAAFAASISAVFEVGAADSGIFVRIRLLRFIRDTHIGTPVWIKYPPQHFYRVKLYLDTHQKSPCYSLPHSKAASNWQRMLRPSSAERNKGRSPSSRAAIRILLNDGLLRPSITAMKLREKLLQWVSTSGSGNSRVVSRGRGAIVQVGPALYRRSRLSSRDPCRLRAPPFPRAGPVVNDRRAVGTLHVNHLTWD